MPTVYPRLIQTEKGTNRVHRGLMEESSRSITFTTSQRYNAFAFAWNCHIHKRTCPFASWSTNFHSSSPLSKALIRPSSAHPLERVGDTGPVVIWESTLSRLLMRWPCGNQGQGVFPRILTADMLREARCQLVQVCKERS